MAWTDRFSDASISNDRTIFPFCSNPAFLPFIVTSSSKDFQVLYIDLCFTICHGHYIMITISFRMQGGYYAYTECIIIHVLFSFGVILFRPVNWISDRLDSIVDRKTQTQIPSHCIRYLLQFDSVNLLICEYVIVCNDMYYPLFGDKYEVLFSMMCISLSCHVFSTSKSRAWPRPRLYCRPCPRKWPLTSFVFFNPACWYAFVLVTWGMHENAPLTGSISPRGWDDGAASGWWWYVGSSNSHRHQHTDA